MYSIEQLKKIIEYLQAKIKQLDPYGDLIYQTVLKNVGKDLTTIAPDELGCAETVSRILEQCFGDKPITISTYYFYQIFKGSEKWKQVYNPIRGDIIISPTGYGKTAHGHIGFIGLNNIIYSNNSLTGKLEPNFTIATWIAQYSKMGYPTFYFRRVKI